MAKPSVAGLHSREADDAASTLARRRSCSIMMLRRFLNTRTVGLNFPGQHLAHDFDDVLPVQAADFLDGHPKREQRRDY